MIAKHYRAAFGTIVLMSPALRWGPSGGLWHTYPHMSRNARRRQYRHQLRSIADPSHDRYSPCACCCTDCDHEGPMRALSGLTEDREGTWRYARGKYSYGPAPLPFRHRRTRWRKPA